MARVDLDAVAEIDEPPKRMEQIFGAVVRLDREVGPRGVADEERVAGEHEPRLVAARAVDHREGAVLRPVPRRMDRADDDVAELDLGAVGQSVVRKRRFRGGVDVHRHAVLEREPPVSRDVIGVGMRLEHADEPDAAASALIQIGLDRVGRIDDDGHTCMLVTDDVRPTAEVVVDELREEHSTRR